MHHKNHSQAFLSYIEICSPGDEWGLLEDHPRHRSHFAKARHLKQKKIEQQWDDGAQIQQMESFFSYYCISIAVLSILSTTLLLWALLML